MAVVVLFVLVLEEKKKTSFSYPIFKGNHWLLLEKTTKSPEINTDNPGNLARQGTGSEKPGKSLWHWTKQELFALHVGQKHSVVLTYKMKAE